MSYIVTEAVSGTAFRSITLNDGSKLPQSVSSTADGIAVSVSNPLAVAVQGTVTTTLTGGATVALAAGGAAIGTVGVTTLPALPTGSNTIGGVNVITLPALPTGSNTIGTVNLASASVIRLNDGAGAPYTATNPLVTTEKLVDSAGVATAPVFLKIDSAASGDVTLVAAVSGKRIRVLQYVLVAAGATTVAFKDGATAVTGAMALVANSGVSSGYSPVGVVQTTVNTNLVLTLSAAVQVSGHLVYVLV